MGLIHKIFTDPKGVKARCNLPSSYVVFLRRKGYSTTLVDIEVVGEKLIISPVREENATDTISRFSYEKCDRGGDMT